MVIRLDRPWNVGRGESLCWEGRTDGLLVIGGCYLVSVELATPYYTMQYYLAAASVCLVACMQAVAVHQPTCRLCMVAMETLNFLHSTCEVRPRTQLVYCHTSLYSPIL